MAANHTPNLNLPQWDALDPFKRTEFNDAFATLDDAVAPKANIAFGSYVGTGTHGQNNPTSLTFDFEPKVVIIRATSPSGLSGGVYGTTLVKGTDIQYNDTYSMNSSHCYPSFSNHSVHWYSDTGHAGDQCNTSGVRYYYIAIG